MWRTLLCSGTASKIDFSSFDLQMSKVRCSDSFYCVLICRLPGFNSGFLSECSEFLSSIIMLDRDLWLVILIFTLMTSAAADLINLTESFNFIQHVSGATHITGHTLDLDVMLGLIIDCVCSAFTDHDCVVFNLSFNVDSLPVLS